MQIDTTRHPAQSEGLPDPHGAAWWTHSDFLSQSKDYGKQRALSQPLTLDFKSPESTAFQVSFPWNENLHKYNTVVPNIRGWSQPKGQTQRTQSDSRWVISSPDTLDRFLCRSEEEEKREGQLGRQPRGGMKNSAVATASLPSIFSQPRSWGQWTRLSWAAAVGKAPARSQCVCSDSLSSLAHRGLTLLPENVLK